MAGLQSSVRFQALARRHTRQSVEALLAALQRPDERVRAAEVLLAHGIRSPTQHLDVSGPLTLEDMVTALPANVAPTAERSASLLLPG